MNIKISCILFMTAIGVRAIFEVNSLVQGWPFTTTAGYFFYHDFSIYYLQSQNGSEFVQALQIKDSSVITTHLNLTLPNYESAHALTNPDYTKSFLFGGLSYFEISRNCDTMSVQIPSVSALTFGLSENEVFYSVNDAAGAKIFLIDQSNVTIQIGTEVYPQVIDLKIQGNLLYAISSLSGILYNKNIYSLSTSPPSSLGNTTSNPYVELSSHFNVFYSATQIKVQGLDGSLITTLSSANIKTAKPLDEISIIIQYTNNTLSQYHVFQNIVMDQYIETELTNFKVYVGLSKVIFVDESLNKLKKMAINKNYQCLSPPCTCITGYTLSGSVCEVDFYSPSSLTPFNAPSNILYIQSATQFCVDSEINTTVNNNPNNTNNSITLNNTNDTMTNTTVNNGSVNQTDPSLINDQRSEDIKQSSEEQDGSPIRAISRVIGNAQSFVYFPTILKISVPIFLFVEDLMLYQFHHGANYTSFMVLCMKETNIIKYLQLNPDFVQFLEMEIPIDDRSQRFNRRYIDSILLQEQEKVGVQVSEIYFPTTIKQMIYPSLPLSLTIFLIFSAISLILRKSATNSHWLRDFSGEMRNRLKIWAFLPLILDPFIMPICYSSFNQLTVFASFEFENKLYLILTLMTLFVLIIFAICFHFLVFRYSYRARDKLLSFTKSRRTSYLIQAYLIYVSKILHSLIHSNVIASHDNKLISLVCLDFLLFLVIVISRKNFMNRLLFIAFALYRITFILLNILLLLGSRSPNLIQYGTYERIIFYLLVSLLTLTLMKIIGSIFEQIREIVRYVAGKKKRIGPALKKPQKNIIDQGDRDSKPRNSLMERADDKPYLVLLSSAIKKNKSSQRNVFDQNSSSSGSSVLEIQIISNNKSQKQSSQLDYGKKPLKTEIVPKSKEKKVKREKTIQPNKMLNISQF